MTEAGLHHREVGGIRIASRIRDGASPTLLFLPGYASDMDGAKAVAIDGFAAARGIGMVRFDYSGTGLSDGEFEAGTLDRWLAEAEAIAGATSGPLVVIGSSMGGWIGLHLALRIPDRVAALVGIAAAPDFTQWGFGMEEKRILAAEGRLELPNPYGGEPQVTSRAFWESGQEMRLLEGPIPIRCPVRLIHGDADEDVPLEIAFRLKDRLHSGDVQIRVIKHGGHRLSEPHEIGAILATIAELTETR